LLWGGKLSKKKREKNSGRFRSMRNFNWDKTKKKKKKVKKQRKK